MMPGRVNHRSIQTPQQIQPRPSTTARRMAQRTPHVPQKQLKLRYTAHGTNKDHQTASRPFSIGRSTAVAIPVEKTVVKTDTHEVQPNPSMSTSITENGQHISRPFSPSNEDTKTSSPFTVISFSASKEPTRHPFATTVSRGMQAHHIIPATPLPTTAQSHTKQNEENTENGEETRAKLEMSSNKRQDEEQEEDEVVEIRKGGKEMVDSKEEVREDKTWNKKTDASKLPTPVIGESPQTTTTTPSKKLSSIQRIRNFMARKRAQMRATTTTATTTTATTTTPAPTTTTTTGATPQHTTRRKTNARRFPATSNRPLTFYQRKPTTTPHTTTLSPTTAPHTTTLNASRHKSHDSFPESSQILRTEESLLQNFPDMTDLKDFLHWESTRLRPEQDSSNEDLIPEGTSVSFVSVVPPGGVRQVLQPRMVKDTQEKVLVSPTYASVGWSTPYKTVDREKTSKERLIDQQTDRQTDAATTYPS
ncbi:soluble scavenger receptor cysteine-rich domain-containing protein SSC5D-like [Scylla paramamosain]|uniref:soluble scavenger receptor cysteine-rich domain-containing protein SSC5D-like n=1 Tax=Scylla paramamosain TaxID=85552 RepID=UPI0030829EEF